MLTEANRLMGKRVVELEGQQLGGRSEREVHLEKELDEVRDEKKFQERDM